MPPMPNPDLASLERRLEARLLELDGLQQKRPHLPDALARADAGRDAKGQDSVASWVADVGHCANR